MYVMVISGINGPPFSPIAGCSLAVPITKTMPRMNHSLRARSSRPMLPVIRNDCPKSHKRRGSAAVPNAALISAAPAGDPGAETRLQRSPPSFTAHH